MTHVTCWLTAENRNQLRNPALCNRVRATFAFLPHLYPVHKWNESIHAFPLLPLSIIAPCPIIISRPADGWNLSWPVFCRTTHGHTGIARYRPMLWPSVCSSSMTHRYRVEMSEWTKLVLELLVTLAFLQIKGTFVWNLELPNLADRLEERLRNDRFHVE